MAGSPERSIVTRTFERVNIFTRNIALFTAATGALFAPAIVVPALLWAAGDQVMIIAINAYERKKEKPATQQIAKSGFIFKGA